ncbi:MAG: hypothetical protein BWZ08_01565 [candidate division BRC1 bacterium ADurb.BinA292]|nr:MAG: hypothetical protein BWZ08_01565 [candidate division BRC1 bacterium ADurb.BinA292]
MLRRLHPGLRVAGQRAGAGKAEHDDAGADIARDSAGRSRARKPQRMVDAQQQNPEIGEQAQRPRNWKHRQAQPVGQCELQRPQQVGVAFDPLAQVVFERAVANQVFRIAHRDERIVERPPAVHRGMEDERDGADAENAGKPGAIAWGLGAVVRHRQRRITAFPVAARRHSVRTVNLSHGGGQWSIDSSPGCDTGRPCRIHPSGK